MLIALIFVKYALMEVHALNAMLDSIILNNNANHNAIVLLIGIQLHQLAKIAVVFA